MLCTASRDGHGSGGLGLDVKYYLIRLSQVCKASTHLPSFKVVRLDGWDDWFWQAGTVRLVGLYFLQQITTTTNSKPQTQPKKKINTSPNTHHKSPIFDRTSESEGGVVAELARSGQNPVRSHKIR